MELKSTEYNWSINIFLPILKVTFSPRSPDPKVCIKEFNWNSHQKQYIISLITEPDTPTVLFSLDFQNYMGHMEGSGL